MHQNLKSHLSCDYDIHAHTHTYTHARTHTHIFTTSRGPETGFSVNLINLATAVATSVKMGKGPDF